jgi:two-component system, NarL family, nitrate/nitrite response regulator NarL
VPLILIVDDNPGFSASARILLESHGFEVAEAGTGTAGVQSARELAPDLVLLDIQLPDIDGFEVAERLASLDPRPPVLLISSRAASDYGSLIIDQSPTLGFLPKDELSPASIRTFVPELDDGRPRQHPCTSGRRSRATSDAYARRARG